MPYPIPDYAAGYDKPYKIYGAGISRKYPYRRPYGHNRNTVHYVPDERLPPALRFRPPFRKSTRSGPIISSENRLGSCLRIRSELALSIPVENLFHFQWLLSTLDRYLRGGYIIHKRHFAPATSICPSQLSVNSISQCIWRIPIRFSPEFSNSI
jgi:hypothetical protein